MLLHIVRHADPDYTTDTITERGTREAEALARRLATRSIDALYTSPLGRARQTAAIVAANSGAAVVELEWAAELRSPDVEDGAGNSTVPFWNVAGEYVRGGVVDPGDWTGYDLYRVPTARRQVTAEVDRVRQGSDSLLAQHRLDRSATGVYRVRGELPSEIAVVCHGGLGVVWIAHLLGLPVPLSWCGLFLATTSVTTIRFERRSPGIAVPRAIAVGDTGHLQAAGLPENLAGLPAGL